MRFGLKRTLRCVIWVKSWKLEALIWAGSAVIGQSTHLLYWKMQSSISISQHIITFRAVAAPVLTAYPIPSIQGLDHLLHHMPTHKDSIKISLTVLKPSVQWALKLSQYIAKPSKPTRSYHQVFVVFLPVRDVMIAFDIVDTIARVEFERWQRRRKKTHF